MGIVKQSKKQLEDIFKEYESKAWEHLNQFSGDLSFNKLKYLQFFYDSVEIVARHLGYKTTTQQVEYPNGHGPRFFCSTSRTRPFKVNIPIRNKEASLIFKAATYNKQPYSQSVIKFEKIKIPLLMRKYEKNDLQNLKDLLNLSVRLFEEKVKQRNKMLFPYREVLEDLTKEPVN